VTADREHPAAYIRTAFGGDADIARYGEAAAEGARQRGWPPPQVYAEAPGLADEYGPALARLETAIEEGRHDALLITDPGAVTGTELAVMTSRAEGPEPRKSPRLLDPLPARWKPDTDSAEAAPGRRHTDLEPNRAAAELCREAAGPGLGQAG
jgi:hypothetical protein